MRVIVAYNPGQDLAAVEAKLASKAALKRRSIAFFAGGVALTFFVAVLPPQAVQNLLRYLFLEVQFELGKMGLTQFSQRDQLALAKAATLVSHEGHLCGLIVRLSVAVSAAVYGLLSYLFLAPRAALET